MAIRVGFIGTGGIAEYAHMRALPQIEGVELVAFCDVVEEKAKAVAQRHGGVAYADFRPMLEKERLDAVYISVPPFAHGEPEIAAARKGAHLFIEKPVVNSMATARQIQEAVKAAGIITSVGYHWRYADTTDYGREQLGNRTIGMVLGYWMGGLPGTAWWRVKAQSGGQLLEQTTHIFDLARYLAGEVKRVSAATALRSLKEVPNLDIPDVGSVLLEFENGAVGVISNTCLLNLGYRVGLNVVCRDLVVEFGSGSTRILEPGKTTEVSHKTDPYLTENQAFIQAIRTSNRSLVRSPYDDGVRSAVVSLAANQSAETGQPVALESLLGKG